MNDWRELTKQKRFTEAEPLLADHYAKDSPHGEHVVDRAWFYEEWGAEAQQTNVEQARELYGKSLESYQMFASWATSGGEGLARMVDVKRLQQKLKSLEKKSNSSAKARAHRKGAKNTKKKI